MIKKKELLLVGIIFFSVIIIFLFLKYRRESDKWIEDIKLLNGDIIKVHHHFSQRAMYGPLHFLIGGGGEKYEIKFNYKKKSYKWVCIHAPIVIQFWKDDLYLIMFDSEKRSDLILHFYKYDKKLKIISADEFPKSVAVQNRWSEHEYGAYRVYFNSKKYPIKPDNPLFRESFTAKIWVCLISKKEIGEFGLFDAVDKNFLIEYKKKYIDPVWGDL